MAMNMCQRGSINLMVLQIISLSIILCLFMLRSGVYFFEASIARRQFQQQTHTFHLLQEYATVLYEKLACELLPGQQIHHICKEPFFEEGGSFGAITIIMHKESYTVLLELIQGASKAKKQITYNKVHSA